MYNKFLCFVFVLAVSCFNIASAFESFKTPQGQVVIVEEMPNNPIVTIDTWIKTGSVNENDANSGVSHFLEHLFFKGTQKYPTGMFDKILESKGAVNNAATSKDFTHYYITIPSKDFDTALQLHADMLLNPLIPRKELEMERKVVLEEIAKNKDNPERVLYNNFVSLMYKNHPYHREVIGNSEVIETISREDILNYYNKYYVPSNMITVIVGDVKVEDVKEKINQYFVTKNSNKPIVNFYQNDKKISKQTQKIENYDVKNGYMLIGFRAVDFKNKKDAYALDVLGTIFGDGKTSRLYQSLKDKKQLVTSIGAYHSSYKLDSIFAVKANFEPQNYETVKQEILNEIELIKNEPISSQEIEKAKKVIERDTYYSRESGSSIASQLGYTTVLYDSPQFYDEYINEINKVTEDDLKRVAKKYLNSNQAGISILLPKDFKMPEKILNQEENAVAKVINQDKNTTKYLLGNGATLLINENKTNDIIAIKMFSLGGNYIIKKAGVSSIMANAMLKGTQKYSSYELAAIMEESGIKIVPASTPDTFTISLKTTKNELDKSLELLDEIVNNATFNTYEVDKVKKDKLAQIRQKRDNPFQIAVEEFKTKIWENNPYGTTGKILEKTIPTIKESEIRELYSQIFEPQNTVISINGNVDSQKMINYFSSILKNKHNKKINISEFKGLNTPLEKSQTININKDGNTAWILIGWQACGCDNQKDWATLQVIDSILGTGMSSRLFVNLRDERGLAYQIGSFYMSNVNHGLLGVYIGTNPKNYSLATKDLFKEINKLKTQFVSEKELSEAQDKLLGHYLLSKETNMEKASTLGWFEISNRGYQFDEKYPQIIKSVTSEDIINVANKYFNDKYIITVVAPQKEFK